MNADDDDFDESIIDIIKEILEEEKLIFTIDEILELVIKKYNISTDDLKNIIKNKHINKCVDYCNYVIKYNDLLKIRYLKCIDCNHKTNCKECINIYEKDLNRFGKLGSDYTYVYEECYKCKEKLYVRACICCKSTSCTCGCPCGCCC